MQNLALLSAEKSSQNGYKVIVQRLQFYTLLRFAFGLHLSLEAGCQITIFRGSYIILHISPCNEKRASQ